MAFLSGCGGAGIPSGSEQPSTAVSEPSIAPVLTATPPAVQETPAATEQPAIPETRRLTLEFPRKIKAGVENEIIRLTLEVDELGNITPTAEFQGGVVTGKVVELPDLYETHNVTAEARLDIAGMLVQPTGSIFQPLKRGESVTFYWSIRSPEPGKYRGTVWLHLNFVERASGEESRMALSAQFVEIEAVDFFGFSVNFVRASGVVGSVLGIIAGFPFLDDLIKMLWSRREKRRKPAKR